MEQVKVWGDLACFTRPEFPSERVSYEVMTPSAAKGILESIFWKPQFTWIVREIAVLKPIRRVSVVRNEIGRRQRAYQLDTHYYADDTERRGHRQQRHTLMLRDVEYIIRAQIRPHDGSGDSLYKYADQFRRRVKRGACFQQPFLGARECMAFFGPVSGDETPIDVTEDLGYMLEAVEFNRDEESGVLRWYEHDEDGRHLVNGNARPRFFNARLEGGVLRVA